MKDRSFDKVFVRPPGNSFSRPEPHLVCNKINLNLAKEQHEEYVSVLKECGIDVVRLPPNEQFPNSVFMQDPAVIGIAMTFIGRLRHAVRKGEERLLVMDMLDRNEPKGKLRRIKSPGTFEGGDIMVTDKMIFAGNSKRTNRKGIDQFSKHSPLPITTIKTPLMHLQCACSYLGDGRIIMAPDLIDPNLFVGFKSVFVPECDSYSANVLGVGDSKVMIPSGFPKTKAKLKEIGYKPIEVNISEFRKDLGSMTCLCAPVFNDL